MLQGEGPLLTIAQISVTLAGFSGVMIALRGSGHHAWSAQDRFGLANVLGASVGTLFGSLLPFPLAYLGWSQELVWGIANGALGILVLGVVSFLVHTVLRGSIPPRTPRVFWSCAASGLLVAAMLLLAAFDMVFPRGPSLLLVGLIWALLAAFAQLSTFVLVTWSGGS